MNSTMLMSIWLKKKKSQLFYIVALAEVCPECYKVSDCGER
jgi:hypothetical protein